jgi:maltokinase
MTALTEALEAWLPGQRWYGDKGRVIRDLTAEIVATIKDDDPKLHVAIVTIAFEDGASSRYQVLLGARQSAPDNLSHAVIDAVEHEGEEFIAFDAVHDSDAMSHLLQALGSGEAVGDVSFHGEVENAPLTNRLFGGEQSNSSVVYGDELILKLFRKLSVGVNPDLEVSSALAEAGCDVIAPPLAWYQLESDTQPATLGLLQPYFKGGTDGWLLAITSVRDLLADPANTAEDAGGDFAPESERLGEVTGILHKDLRRALGSRPAGASDHRATAEQMIERLGVAVESVETLGEFADEIRSVFEQAAEAPVTDDLQRIHGDYHLGQVMRTDQGWVVLDFEGEPSRTLSERQALMSPLRDVAAMLRSFEYASRHHLVELPEPGDELLERAQEWSERNSSAFCDGYARSGGVDPREFGVLLTAYQLDKAVYEVVYETRNRPSWVEIPLGSITRLVRT